MMMDITKNTLVHLFLLVALSVRSICASAALLQIPTNVRVDSEVVCSDVDKFDLYTVDEFVDATDGSCHLRVLNENNPAPNYLPDLTSYYRIKQTGGDFGGQPWNDKVVAYNHKSQLCSEQSTSSDWKLTSLTEALTLLIQSDELDTKAIEADRTAIGPLALLKIVYANAHLFKVGMRAFDEIRLSDMYYFQTTISLGDDGLSAKVICAIPVMHIEDKDQIKMDRTLLSEVSASNHLHTVAVVYLGEKDTLSRNKKNLVELLDPYDDSLKRLIVAYYLVQEQSASRHMGLKFGSLAAEENPFTLPSRAACGFVSKHNPFHVGANQFSGLFRAKTLPNQRFVAYDSETKHLRLDSVGEYRMVYDLSERRVTYVGDHDHLYDVQVPAADRDKESFDDRAHCAQSVLLIGDDTDRISEVKSLDDLLGFDRYTGLMYLGTTFLEDGTHCIVFEREITRRQVPLLAKLNLRLSLRDNDRDRLFLVYYFVDELKVTNLDPTFAFRSMWLKRLELYTRSELTTHAFMNSQLTFSASAWTLESMDPSLAMRREVDDLGLLHPVRMFDTMGCTSKHELVQLSLLIKEMPDSDWVKSTVMKNINYAASREFWSQAESFEEAMMVTLSRRLKIPRSQINELELVEPRSGAIRTNEDQEDSGRLLLVRAKLSTPMNYKFERMLIGWLRSYGSVPFEKYGQLVKQVSGMTRYECSLLLASKFKSNLKVYMVFGPNVGCGYLEDPESLEYIKRIPATEKAPRLEDYFDMCEIYLLSKMVDSDAVTSNKYTSGSIENKLRNLKLTVELDRIERERGSEKILSSIFTGMVVKTSAIKALSADSLGSITNRAICYTDQVQPIQPKEDNDADGEESKFQLKIMDLEFDQHHSLVHCHKACQMYTHCSSYSYSRSTRECILTNLPRTSSPKTNFIGLKEDKSCDMFEPNAVHMYQSNSVVTFSTVSGLVERQHYSAETNLNGCASLCRLYELNERVNCRSFKFFRLLSICLIEDKDNVLKDALPVDADLSSDLQSSEWRSLHQYYMYNRDFAQYYAIEHFSKLELKSKGTPVSSQVEQDVTRKPKGDLIGLQPGFVLYGLEYDDCLRECTLINPSCVMVDHCVHFVLTKRCTLYLLEGTMLETGQKSSPLADADVIYYLNSQVKERYDLSKDYGCTHHFLKGDNLLLKLQMLRRHLSGGNNGDAAIKRLEDEDLKKSESYLKQVQKLVQDYGAKISPSSMSITSSLLFLVMGSFFGIMLFLYQPQLARFRQLRFAKQRFASVKWFQGSRDRSASRVEFNELEDYM